MEGAAQVHQGIELALELCSVVAAALSHFVNLA